MESKSKIKGISYDKYGNPLVTFAIPPKFEKEIQELAKDDFIALSVKKYRKKRSLDANAYAWALIDKIAEKSNIPKEEIYRHYIKNIGGTSMIICVPEELADRIRKDWHLNGIGWQTDVMPSKLDGCTNIILYEGSSVYDTAQMSRLIDMIIQDCKILEIETDTPEEIAKRIERWK